MRKKELRNVTQEIGVAMKMMRRCLVDLEGAATCPEAEKRLLINTNKKWFSRTSQSKTVGNLI